MDAKGFVLQKLCQSPENSVLELGQLSSERHYKICHLRGGHTSWVFGLIYQISYPLHNKAQQAWDTAQTFRCPGREKVSPVSTVAHQRWPDRGWRVEEVLGHSLVSCVCSSAILPRLALKIVFWVPQRHKLPKANELISHPAS